MPYDRSESAVREVPEQWRSLLPSRRVFRRNALALRFAEI
jgi:hypothetical protein